MIFRIILSVLLVIGDSILSNIWYPLSSIGAANMAGKQLENTNIGAVQANTGVGFFHGIGGLCSLGVLILLAIIWYPVIKTKLKPIVTTVTILALVFGLSTNSAFAYYSQQDKAEAVGIPPNSTAFWIPDQGNTAANQVQTDDAAFYNANKVPGKIFIVPHHVFQNSGGVHLWDADYYVPDGKLILVDRTPITREWTSGNGTGTSATNQGFQCQSNDGLNISAAVSIAVSIKPSDAATYLYYFGTDSIAPNPNDSYMSANPNADPANDPEVIFASVYHAKSLANVMDTVGHGLVEAAVCQAIGANDLKTDNQNYNQIMTQVQTAANNYLSQRGITIDYIGWAGTFGFDQDVQQAINNAFTAQTIGPYIPVLQQAALIQAIQNWNHVLPTNITLVGSNFLSDLFSFAPGTGTSHPTTTK
jgi:hypothetical protein